MIPRSQTVVVQCAFLTHSSAPILCAHYTHPSLSLACLTLTDKQHTGFHALEIQNLNTRPSLTGTLKPKCAHMFLAGLTFASWMASQTYLRLMGSIPGSK